ncbi:MAG: hypothetical protein HY653_00600 [Acidobacteria bacterium]|nr:hypothetical protein [Acidobacteriota bacterium]
MAAPAESGERIHRQHGWAWVALCVTLALHVTDEALTNFLSVYNPIAQAIRERWSFLPLPVFTFEAWLGGLILAVTLLLALSPLVFRDNRAMVPVSYLFGAIMLANGLLHLLGSVYLGRWMPGAYSAPVLLVSSVYLLSVTRRRQKWAGARL